MDFSRQSGPASEPAPAVTVDNILLGMALGAGCPHLLCQLFRVEMLDGDVVQVLNTWIFDGVASVVDWHTAPDGLMCPEVALKAPLTSVRALWSLDGLPPFPHWPT